MSHFLGRTSLLATTIWQFIDFPTDRQTNTNKNQEQATFMRIVGFPGVVRAIDGTHVHIIAPTVHEETYQYKMKHQ